MAPRDKSRHSTASRYLVVEFLASFCYGIWKVFSLFVTGAFTVNTQVVVATFEIRPSPDAPFAATAFYFSLYGDY